MPWYRQDAMAWVGSADAIVWVGPADAIVRQDVMARVGPADTMVWVGCHGTGRVGGGYGMGRAC